VTRGRIESDLDALEAERQEHVDKSDDTRFDSNYPASSRPPGDAEHHRRIGPTQRYDDPT
jgi:hypothetical protein